MTSNSNNKTEVLQTKLVCSSSAFQMLNDKTPLKIHTVFDRGINLTDGKKPELLYIGPNFPGTLVANGVMIDKEIFMKLIHQLKEGTRVQLKKDQLIFYARPQVITVQIEEFKKVDLYIPSVKKEDLEATKLQEKIAKENVIERSGFKKNKVWLNILQNILENDKIQEEDVLNLIGAGVGLTPSGDDFLQGAILMETALGNPPELKRIVQSSLEKRSTTAISVSYYTLLFKGTVNAPWQALLEAVNDRDEDAILQQLQIIQTFGHTSGKDILVGAWTYLKLNKIG